MNSAAAARSTAAPATAMTMTTRDGFGAGAESDDDAMCTGLAVLVASASWGGRGELACGGVIMPKPEGPNESMRTVACGGVTTAGTKGCVRIAFVPVIASAMTSFAIGAP
jgi:hypothetical protein